VNTIVEYIYQNTPGQTLGGGGEQYVDPYTGELAWYQEVA
jgi:hypothetical protein